VPTYGLCGMRRILHKLQFLRATFERNCHSLAVVMIGLLFHGEYFYIRFRILHCIALIKCDNRCLLCICRDVKVYRLISKNSIEEAILHCAERKLKLEMDVTGSGQKGIMLLFDCFVAIHTSVIIFNHNRRLYRRLCGRVKCQL